MQPNDEIMLAVFELFITNPHSFFETKRKRDFVSSNEIEALYPVGSPYDDTLLRWHVIAFLSEFILDADYVTACGNLSFPGTDGLNWSGKQLYEKLIAGKPQ